MVGRYPMLEKNKAVHKTVLKVFLMSFWTSGRGFLKKIVRLQTPARQKADFKAAFAQSLRSTPFEVRQVVPAGRLPEASPTAGHGGVPPVTSRSRARLLIGSILYIIHIL